MLWHEPREKVLISLSSGPDSQLQHGFLFHFFFGKCWRVPLVVGWCRASIIRIHLSMRRLRRWGVVFTSWVYSSKLQNLGQAKLFSVKLFSREWLPYSYLSEWMHRVKNWASHLRNTANNSIKTRFLEKREEDCCIVVIVSYLIFAVQWVGLECSYTTWIPV